ncbi:hypothetical protein OH76DRAFT_1005916 [Lentinus brumalis]|uniref:Uncharacterized protein n=1 Tax=Lentinus brumalis TaxID=2498619 RepID=A0A371CYN0_9APHY|nr:hypothetical protein OH76DRAFT_1005916 [Polyporus brumalis]
MRQKTTCSNTSTPRDVSGVLSGGWERKRGIGCSGFKWTKLSVVFSIWIVVLCHSGGRGFGLLFLSPTSLVHTQVPRTDVTPQIILHQSSKSKSRKWTDAAMVKTTVLDCARDAHQRAVKAPPPFHSPPYPLSPSPPFHSSRPADHPLCLPSPCMQISIDVSALWRCVSGCPSHSGG